ncbi:MAG TPA: Rap1a/Tai family immunity protein [Rhizomicrobium sp.]|nr:Rap1a/Tai family immunity protein [Rhizomicrobium sp.]
MKRLLVASVAAAFCLTASAQAQYGGFGLLLHPRDANMGYKDGRDVLQLCTAQDDTQLLECLGFLEGVSDLVVAERKAQGLPDCYPEGNGKVDQIAIQQTLIAYLIAHPERRSEQGASVVKAAIQARWCAH